MQRFEHGIDPAELGQPITAAAASYVGFSLGALFPLVSHRCLARRAMSSISHQLHLIRARIAVAAAALARVGLRTAWLAPA